MTSIPLITQCPCGSLYLPKGKAFSTSGLHINVSVGNSTTELNLLHSEDIYLESGEKFVTVTPIITEHVIPTKVAISYALPMTIKNIIQVIIKDKLSKAILGTQYIGKYNETTTVDDIAVDLHSSIDLYDNSIIIEIHSLCDNGSDPCCDKLPSEIDIVGPRLLCVPLGQYYVLPTTTTTTTPEPFTIEFLNTPTNQIVNANNKATFSFSAITIYDKNFKYWWEKSEDNGSSWKKASRLLEGESRKIHTLVVLATLPMNNTKYRVVIVEPKIKYSNVATLFVIQPTTTTTTTTTFNPVTTTLPPCDMQIMGFDSSTTTTTTTTTITPAATTSTTTTITTTTTTLAPAGSYFLVHGTGSNLVDGAYCLNGTNAGKNKYTKSDGLYDLIWDVSGMWLLKYDISDIFYTNDTDSVDPPLNGWVFQNSSMSPSPEIIPSMGYVVSGAGSSNVNGTYCNIIRCESQTTGGCSGKPLLTRITQTDPTTIQVYIQRKTDGTWHILDGHGSSLSYYINSQNSTSVPLTGWQLGNAGALPVPTLTQTNNGCCY